MAQAPVRPRSTTCAQQRAHSAISQIVDADATTPVDSVPSTRGVSDLRAERTALSEQNVALSADKVALSMDNTALSADNAALIANESAHIAAAANASERIAALERDLATAKRGLATCSDQLVRLKAQLRHELGALGGVSWGPDIEKAPRRGRERIERLHEQVEKWKGEAMTNRHLLKDMANQAEAACDATMVRKAEEKVRLLSERLTAHQTAARHARGAQAAELRAALTTIVHLRNDAVHHRNEKCRVAHERDLTETRRDVAAKRAIELGAQNDKLDSDMRTLCEERDDLIDQGVVVQVNLCWHRLV